ncbi:MAG TPA: response regulator [Flavitalea sp.]|nr:response regulator [Flavitalea sp.]
MTKRKVLIVDDDPDDRELIRNALLECEQSIQIAELDDGSAVIGYLDTHPTPSFLIVDLNMPVMNGFETLQEIRTNKKYVSLPVFIFTTSSSIRDKQHCIRLGATDVFVKPPSYAAWVDMMCGLVETKNVLK